MQVNLKLFLSTLFFNYYYFYWWIFISYFSSLIKLELS